MWGSFSNSVVSFGLKKIFVATSRACLDFADDETSSNGNAEDGLECPICWEYFNIVENVMSYDVVTPSAKTVLGINCAALKFSNQQIQIPFFISCPWCHLLMLRLFYKGNLKFRSKNFFLLWKVESLNGDRMKSPLSMSANNQSVWSLRSHSFFANQASNNYLRRALHSHRLGHSNDSLNGRGPISRFTIRFTKFPLVILLLLIVFVAFPESAAILVLYLLITVLLSLPSFWYCTLLTPVWIG